MTKREIEHASDLDGTALVLVPAGTGDAIATIEKTDYDFLIKSGVSPRWAVSNGTYVSAIKDGKREYISRLITMAGKTQTISYEDGNPLNLRRGNLRVMEKRPVQFPAMREAA